MSRRQPIAWDADALLPHQQLEIQQPDRFRAGHTEQTTGAVSHGVIYQGAPGWPDLIQAQRDAVCGLDDRHEARVYESRGALDRDGLPGPEFINPAPPGATMRLPAIAQPGDFSEQGGATKPSKRKGWRRKNGDDATVGPVRSQSIPLAPIRRTWER